MPIQSKPQNTPCPSRPRAALLIVLCSGPAPAASPAGSRMPCHWWLPCLPPRTHPADHAAPLWLTGASASARECVCLRCDAERFCTPAISRGRPALEPDAAAMHCWVGVGFAALRTRHTCPNQLTLHCPPILPHTHGSAAPRGLAHDFMSGGCRVAAGEDRAAGVRRRCNATAHRKAR